MKKTAAKIFSVLSDISVEPCFFIVIFTSITYQLISQNLYLEKACRVGTAYNSSVCDALTAKDTSGYGKEQEIEVQKLVSQMLAVKTSIQGSIPVFLLLFLGSWSDSKNRRKPLIIFPIIGELISCSLLILNVVFLEELPMMFTPLSDSLPMSLFGGWPIIFLGGYSYIGARSSEANRTVRIGFLTSLQISGLILGTSMAGLVEQMVGLMGVYIICVCSLVIALLLAIVLVKEERSKATNSKERYFISHVRNTIKVAFKNGPNERRKKFLALLFVSVTIFGPFMGELNLNYIYTKFKFGWDVLQYGRFYSVQLIFQVCGAFLTLGLLSRLLHWKDATIGAIALSGSSLASMVYAFAPIETYFYIGASLDFFYMASHISMRSLLTKIVSVQELGQSNSIFGISEASMHLVFGPLYSTIYRFTIDVFPGTYLILSSILKFCGGLTFIWLYKKTIEDRNVAELEQKTCEIPEKSVEYSNHVDSKEKHYEISETLEEL